MMSWHLDSERITSLTWTEGDAQNARSFIGSISDIDTQISYDQHILLSLPKSHPSHLSHVRALAASYYNRYLQSCQKEDLDRSILHFTWAIFVASPWDRDGPNIVEVFLFLAMGLLLRLHHFKRFNDAQYCAEYFRYLQSLSLEKVGLHRLLFNQVKEYLVQALAFQVELGVNNAVQNIDEMTVCCRELVASDIPQPRLRAVIRALISANDANHTQSLAQEDSEKVTECLREAKRRLDSHDFTYYLAGHVSHGFEATCSTDSYEEAMTLLDEIIHSKSHRDCPDSCLENAALEAVSFAHKRSRNGNPECFEEVAYRCRVFLSIPSTDDFDRDTIAELLARALEIRSVNFGVDEGLPEARSRNPQATYVPSFSRLVTSLLTRSTTDKTDLWTKPGKERAQHCRALRFVSRTTDVAEIREAIKYCQLLLAECHPSDSIKYYPAAALGEVLFHAFKYTHKIEYLDESIAAFRNILDMPSANWAHFQVIPHLLRVLSLRISLFKDRMDIEETMQLYSTHSKSTHHSAEDRFLMSCEWARNARLHGHHTSSTAYETAISLMEDTLLFAPTLETQHFHLVTLRDGYEELPLDMASQEVRRGRLKKAIEALERGRALIWSQLRGLRTSTDQLPVDSQLAKEFTEVNRELETVTISGSPCMMTNDDHRLEDGDGMDSFGRIVVQHQKLLAKRKELVSQIQAMPGFENFLKTRSFDDLRAAALFGPVIIINHSKWRSDILVVLRDAHPFLINTPDDFYYRAIELRNRLVGTRKDNTLESRQYHRALRSVLKSLFELVGQPVIKELRRLKIPEQSRIWWCPTSVFCSLPLHAMGPIPSDDGVPRYFSDLYIPSYTPTLSALIESRKSGKSSLEKPSVLLVANPDGAMQEAWPEIWFIKRLDTKVTTLLGKGANASAVLAGLRDHRFVHFVCHGRLVPDKPFDASFGLYGNNRIALLDIIRSRLPAGEFAFLSACHTAELTEGSIADEGLHLTAAVQYCGFRSVVGTMWAMADQDGGDLAKRFYKSIFSSDEPGIPYHERSARALRDAVRFLRRKKNLPLEQWVNFVHYGA